MGRNHYRQSDHEPVGMDGSAGDDATSHISTHARLTFNLMEGLKLSLFGAYTYNIVEIRNTSPLPSGRTVRHTKEPKSANPYWET